MRPLTRPRPLPTLIAWVAALAVIAPTAAGQATATVGDPGPGPEARASYATAASGPTVLAAKRRAVTGDGRRRYAHRGALLRPAGRVALPPKVRMRAWVVLDSATGEVLARKAVHRRLPVASLTKLLTGLTAVERVPELPPAAVPRWAADQICSCAGIKAGRRYDRTSLLTGALLPSGNDAAEALAAADPEGRWAFYTAMNAKAAALGATRTRAGNASGLTVPGAHSTAADMARILDAALADPTLAPILATRTTGAVRTRAGREHRVSQKTHYVQTYAGAAGKSGYTSAALNTLAVRTTVTVVTANGARVPRTLDLVTLGAPGGYSTDGTRALAQWAATWRDQLRPVGRLPRTAPVDGARRR